MAKARDVYVEGGYLHVESSDRRFRVSVCLEKVYPNIDLGSLGKPVIKHQEVVWPETEVKPLSLADLHLIPDRPYRLSLPQKRSISEISGIHPEITSLCEQALDQHLLIHSVPMISRSGIETFLNLNPIILHKHKKQLFVIGNIVGYQMAKSLKDPDFEVLIQLHGGRSQADRKAIIENELLTLPTAYRNRTSPALIFKLWVWIKEKGGFKELLGAPASKSAFAKWIGEDVRQLK